MSNQQIIMSPFYFLVYYTYEAFLNQEISPKTIAPDAPCFWLSETEEQHTCDVIGWKR